MEWFLNVQGETKRWRQRSRDTERENRMRARGKNGCRVWGKGREGCQGRK